MPAIAVSLAEAAAGADMLGRAGISAAEPQAYKQQTLTITESVPVGCINHLARYACTAHSTSFFAAVLLIRELLGKHDNSANARQKQRVAMAVKALDIISLGQ